MIDRKIIVESFATVRNNTIEVAKDIPADKYDWKPEGEGLMSVVEVFRNILRITEFVTGVATYPGVVDFQARPREEWLKELSITDPAKVVDRDTVIAALESSFAAIRRRAESADEKFLNESVKAPDGMTKVRLWIYQTAKEQEMSNRAYLFIYQRMLGIVPHLARRGAPQPPAKN